MNKAIFDLEADGLYRESSKIHCIVIKDYQTKDIFKFWNEGPEGSKLTDVVSKFRQYDELIGHNISGYDLQMMKRYLAFDPIGCKITDTLIISKLTCPDRELHKDCPTRVYNPVEEKNQVIGPHSLAAWGFRVGRIKPSIYKWEEFTPAILDRCVEDVEINTKVYDYLLKEMIKP